MLNDDSSLSYYGKIRLKIIYFKWRLPLVCIWYVVRFLRQQTNLLWLKTFGAYGFRKIGNHVIIDGLPDFIWPGSNIILMDNIRIGKRCVFQGGPVSSIIIGNKVTINDGCHITSLYSIEIGDGTSIGEYTSVRDYNHQFNDPTTPIKSQGYFGSPIKIGRDCWIGRGCVILPGVEIGDGAIIGANSVVTKSIPAFSVAVGIPAKPIKIRGI